MCSFDGTFQFSAAPNGKKGLLSFTTKMDFEVCCFLELVSCKARLPASRGLFLVLYREHSGAF